MSIEDIEKHCQLQGTGKKMMEDAFYRFNLSARSYHRVLKVARTVADLDNSEQINEYHLAEAIYFKFNFDN